MALNVRESSAVNVLLHRLYGPGSAPEGAPTDAEVHAAAVLLAESAHKRLMAGFTPDRLDRAVLTCRRLGGHS